MFQKVFSSLQRECASKVVLPAAAACEGGAAGRVPRRAAPEHADDAEAAEDDEDGAHDDVDHENVPLRGARDALHPSPPRSLSPIRRNHSAITAPRCISAESSVPAAVLLGRIKMPEKFCVRGPANP